MKRQSLAMLRKRKNMSQRDLAEQLDVSCGIIGMYETGKRTPSLQRAMQIAALFDVPVEDISFSSLDKLPH